MGMSEDAGGSRERAFVDFLHSIPADAKALFLLGDIFDFWIDYKDVVPRGHVRTLSALAELVDRGVEVWFYPGNHDWWVTDYFEKELGVKIVHECWSVLDIEGRRVCIGHGDIPGAYAMKSKLIFHLFHSKFWIRVLKALHPNRVFALARRWTRSSRRKHPPVTEVASTGLYRFVDDLGRNLKDSGQPGVDLYIFGHIHTPAHIPVPSGGELIVLGDWSQGPEYYCF